MFKVYKNNDIKINFEIDRKINLYSYCVDCGFKSSKPLINMTLVIYEKKQTLFKKFLSYCFKCKNNNKRK